MILVNHRIVRFLQVTIFLILLLKLTAPQSNHNYFPVNLALLQGMVASCFHKTCIIRLTFLRSELAVSFCGTHTVKCYGTVALIYTVSKNYYIILT